MRIWSDRPVMLKEMRYPFLGWEGAPQTAGSRKHAGAGGQRPLNPFSSLRYLLWLARIALISSCWKVCLLLLKCLLLIFLSCRGKYIYPLTHINCVLCASQQCLVLTVNPGKWLWGTRWVCCLTLGTFFKYKHQWKVHSFQINWIRN